jgi:hypothetical protein
MTRLEQRSTRTGQHFDVAIRTALLLFLVAGLTACATTSKVARTPSVVSESDYARAPAGKTQRVDDARAQLAAASDALGRAKLSSVDDQHEGTFARADQASAKADRSRAAAETRASQESNDPGKLQQARDDTRAAQQDTLSADARLAYSKKLATSRAAQVVAADRLVALRTEALNLAKLDTLLDAGVPAAGKYDRVAAVDRVNAAQRAYEDASASAASAAAETAAAKGARSTQGDSAEGAPRPPTP